ncbi:unnamed protein product [Mytilus edulis]|uniref:CCHC-type domain-containing protein n=1 Tax=Mytilus edulis TaxID=6550 RepID=A0A8S3SLL7_MYTED|nr:unnamed protein product [Mytilus edulis]
MLRFKRCTNDPVDLQTQYALFSERLIKRGYPKNEIKTVMQEVTAKQRKDTLMVKPKSVLQSPPLVFSTVFSRQKSHIKKNILKPAAEMSDFECDDNETPQLLKPRDESPDREIMFRRNIGPSGSGTAGDDDEARQEYQLGPNQRDLPDRNQNIRGNNPDFDNQIPTGFPRGNTSGTTIKPEPYNGKDSWEEYISHFENCADLGRWKESEKVLLLAASLRGPARTTLEQRFGNARHQNRWLSRFETRTRQPQEPIANFGDDLRQMAQKAYSNLDTRAQEVLALNQLYKNISLEMKCRCIDKDCRSVTEAVDLIERYEALLGDPNDRKRGNIRQVSDTKTYLNTQDTDIPVQSKENESILQQLINRIDRLEHGSNSSQTTQRGPRTCFTCNSPDHFYRNCPLYKRPAGPNQASPPNSNWSKNSPNYQGQRSGNNQQNQGNGYPVIQVGKHLDQWDNGLYTNGTISGYKLDFLIDTGSTVSLISNQVHKDIFQSSPDVNQEYLSNGIQTNSFNYPNIESPQDEYSLQNVNGTNLTTYGMVTLEFSLRSAIFRHQFIVCDITPDAILGQDFLLKHVKKIDYRSHILQTENLDIKCWVGGEFRMTCRVLARDTVVVPSNSISGIINSDDEYPFVQVVNYTDSDVKLYPNTMLGTCESVAAFPELRQDRCAGVNIIPSRQVETDENGVPEHLQDLLTRSCTHLTPKEKMTLAELLNKFQDVFSRSPEDIGRTNKIKHSIDTGDARPVRVPPRRLPIGKREIERTEVSKMLERGIIEPSNSPWSAPLVLITKPDLTTRVCVDFRSLNQLSRVDSYPVGRVDDCLEALSNSKLYNLMDLNSGFWQTLKVALTTSPILAYPVPGQTFILDTDASQQAVGAVLSQEQEGKEHVIAYMSKALSRPEQSYCVTRKELLAVVAALKHFHSYLYGQKCTFKNRQCCSQLDEKFKETYRSDCKMAPGARVPCTSCLNQQTQNDVQNIEEDSKETAIPQCTPLNQIRAVTRSRQVIPSAGLTKIKDLVIDGWDQISLRKSQLDDHEISEILMRIEDKKRPEWNEISNQSAVIKTPYGDNGIDWKYTKVFFTGNGSKMRQKNFCN